MVAVELEVMAKKMDRFGWDRDRGSAAHDRIITDWMDALHDYPLDEIRAACRKWVTKNPRKMPNEGDILGLIGAARHEQWLERKAMMPPAPERPRTDMTPEKAQEILARAGIDVPSHRGSA